MQVFLDADLAYLAMPKTGSTSLHYAMRRRANISFHRAPEQTHMHAEHFEHYIRPYLEGIGKHGVETVCQIREPISWLQSWWRYRSAPGHADSALSTADLSFEDFAGEYLDGVERPYLDISRPIGFLANRKREVLVHTIYRYEDMDLFLELLSRRLGETIKPPRKNASPKRDAPISPAMRSRLEDYFRPELDIWESGTVRDNRSVVQRLGNKAVKMVPNPFR